MLEYDIGGVIDTIAEMREIQRHNKENKAAFLEHIDSKLVLEWNTTNGQEAIAELKDFVNVRFQEYIDYLDERINVLEEVIVPALERIDNA